MRNVNKIHINIATLTQHTHIIIKHKFPPPFQVHFQSAYGYVESKNNNMHQNYCYVL